MEPKMYSTVVIVKNFTSVFKLLLAKENPIFKILGLIITTIYSEILIQVMVILFQTMGTQTLLNLSDARCKL